jgi:hypothetical protein
MRGSIKALKPVKTSIIKSKALPQLQKQEQS